MKWPQRVFLVLLLVCAVLCLAVAALTEGASKWITTAGLLFDLAGLVQLDISGLFDRIVEEYGDAEKYPFGPPSAVTREIIDNPNKPVGRGCAVPSFSMRGRASN